MPRVAALSLRSLGQGGWIVIIIIIIIHHHEDTKGRGVTSYILVRILFSLLPADKETTGNSYYFLSKVYTGADELL